MVKTLEFVKSLCGLLLVVNLFLACILLVYFMTGEANIAVRSSPGLLPAVINSLRGFT